MGIAEYLHGQYCRSKRGIKVIGNVNGKKFKSIGIIDDAKVGKKIVAPLQYSGIMDSLLFEIWFETCLLPAFLTNTTIVMDNASFHRKSRLIVLAQNAGYKLIFLPPYSPELNDIEPVWTNPKRFFRNYGQSFHDVEYRIHWYFLSLILRLRDYICGVGTVSYLIYPITWFAIL